MNADARLRTGLTVLVAAAAALVVAALIAAAPVVDGLVSRLPVVSAPSLLPLAVAVAVAAAAVVAAFATLVRAARSTARSSVIAGSFNTAPACGIRTAELVPRMNELRLDGARPVRLGRRYTVAVDDVGVTFWDGGRRRPRRADAYPWREVRNIRADSVVAGTTVVSVLVLRVRRHKNSVELPIVFAAHGVGRYALSDAAFFAIVRDWKARHRVALAAEGLEVPPLTAPIPVISAEMLAAHRG
ncbi:hypothetical protein [Agromyces sp. Leaf222]|uniref:hypothetical protein n=1 Tax=Agromyces sp. Leaf222 TaxID=1735688 RepID=UPI0006F6B7F1|nr:hypothetical protein [Agromyces sp. Leaf222]KQM82120.1 hypothetical protein ASE68_01410 [Agromyces sp. Leaf222]